MKIGILTFHWATNYGAVLQAFALQTYLLTQGHDCKIIDYVPCNYKKTLFRCFLTRFPLNIFRNLLDYNKESRMDRFRQSHLRLTRNYGSLAELQKDPPDCDVYVCGSDQIWNPSFTRRGEGKVTLSYFLDFGGEQKRRLAYAASFGCTSYPADLIDIIKAPLQRFKALGVRENTGLAILDKIGISDTSLVPDPTMLLRLEDYKGLLPKSETTAVDSVFVYALHSGQKTIQEIRCHLEERNKQTIQYTGFNSHSSLSVEEWLAAIARSKAVVTNSFHGVIFSILFEKPFVAVSVEGHGSGMNDRINTLLGNLGLEERIVITYDDERLVNLLYKPIDWRTVGIRLNSIRDVASRFFERYLDA